MIALLTGCISKPEIRFTEPQQKNKRDLKIIPKKYQGQYLFKSDSSVLTIDSKIIYQEWKGFSTVSDVEMQEKFDTI